jgi:hypothetical protein
MRFALIFVLTTQPLAAADFNFCWKGSNGYTMTGRIGFPDSLLDAPLITENDVTGFKIAGYHNGDQIGTWNMNDRDAFTSWYLRFVPATLTFPTNDMVEGPIDQAWNADGTASDCGTPGFGFNAGNNAQDFCLNGVWIEESGVPPETPFVATAGRITPDCDTAPVLSKR